MLGVGAVGVGSPEDRQVVVINNLTEAAQCVIGKGLVRVCAKFGLQVLGQGAPRCGRVQFCHLAHGR